MTLADRAVTRGGSIAWGLWLAALFGCADSPPAAPSLEAPRFEALLGSRPSLGEPCAGAAAEPPLAGQIALRVLVSPGVTQDAAIDVLRSLPGYWGARGVTLRLVEPPRRIGAASLLGDGAVAQAVAPLARFMQREAVPPTDAVNVVVLSRIAARGSPVARYFSELEGLSLTPAQRAGSSELYDELGLPERFTPTILLGVDDIRRRPPGGPELTAAHELGHVLGLEHGGGDDLMALRPPRCVPPLSAAQRSALAGALSSPR